VFHRHIHVCSGNTALPVAFERLNVHLQMFRLYYGSGIGTEAVREHQAIARAIADRDRDAAAEAMRAHLTESRDRLLPVFADFVAGARADVAVESSA
jgi:DNA-binding FadR family transcriptional regulator